MSPIASAKYYERNGSMSLLRTVRKRSYVWNLDGVPNVVNGVEGPPRSLPASFL